MCVACCVRQLMRLKVSLFCTDINTQTLNGSSQITKDCFDLAVRARGLESLAEIDDDTKLTMTWGSLFGNMFLKCQRRMCCNMFSTQNWWYQQSLRVLTLKGRHFPNTNGLQASLDLFHSCFLFLHESLNQLNAARFGSWWCAHKSAWKIHWEARNLF